MRFFLISDNADTQMGMRLAGIDGVVVHEAREAVAELVKATEDKEIGIILMTQKLINLCEDKVYDIKLHKKRPLIVEIPDRHATSDISSTISRYVQEAIGIKI